MNWRLEEGLKPTWLKRYLDWLGKFKSPVSLGELLSLRLQRKEKHKVDLVLVGCLGFMTYQPLLVT